VHDIHLLTQLAAALVAALLGGLLARLVRLPPLVGYLLAGIAVGPHTPGFFADRQAVEAVARVGVALLMFAVGVQFSLKELASVRRVALIGGSLQILLTTGLGLALGLLLGWSFYSSLFLGCALSLSSTAVMMKVLEGRGELETTHGTVMLGILVVQDLSLVVMVLFLPSIGQLGSGGTGVGLGLVWTLLRALLILAATLLLALRVVPWVLDGVARTGSRELFVLTVVGLCLVAAALAHLAGFSLEIGAFLAGLVVSESEYSHEVFSQVRPLRDVFASLFFVSVGMLLDPRFLLSEWPLVAAVALTIVAGKGIIAAAAVFFFGYHARTALLAGLGLAQIGEFSFVLAATGVQNNLVGEEVSAAILAGALVTLLLAPVVYGGAGPLYARLNRIPAISARMNRRRDAPSPERVLDCRPRVLILGGGRVGGMVSRALRDRDVPHIVVEYDAAARDRLRAYGVPVIYGDATSDTVLARGLAPTLESALVALPEVGSTVIVVRLLREMLPGVPVVARVHRRSDVATVRAAGATDVVHAEFEAALAMIGLSLNRLGLGLKEAGQCAAELREEYEAGQLA
jgi:CPA2 family monovalent cation:H+ antiporter-2